MQPPNASITSEYPPATDAIAAIRRKSARPMHSGIPAFETGYAAFVSDVFTRGINNVACSENETSRIMTLGGAHRYVVSKNSGLLSFATLQHGSVEDPVWVGASLKNIDSLWLSIGQARGLLEGAWAQRLCNFVPSEADVFPNKPAEGSDEWHREYDLKTKYSYVLALAAQRRVGGAQKKIVAVKMVVGTLWNFLLDREMLRLCHDYFGFRASPDEYNFTVRRQHELRARAAETPNLTPLMGAYIRSHARLKSGRYRLPLDLLARAKNILLASSPGEARENGNFYGRPGVPLFYDAITPAGWRYMAAQSRALNETLWAATRGSGSYQTENVLAHCSAMNLLAQGGKSYPFTFAKWLLANVSDVRIQSDSSPDLRVSAQTSVSRFVRLAGDAAVAAKRDGVLKQFLNGDLLLAMDWLKQCEADGDNRLSIPVINKNATWASVMRAQHEWHAQHAERERARREADAAAYTAYLVSQAAIQWISLVGPCESQGTLISPLTTGKSLIEEGVRMVHCVANYIDECRSGTSRIFSLQKNTDYATVELIKTGVHAWRVRQVFGPENDIPDKAFSRAATALAKAYGRASKAI